eukprot:TRINITY_DN16870_c0_g1_i1.p1 TRINITY_DN16870_c0_g1~~TRINITY_DN16870_c0_g1_i1.p1  ORF type:complete len:251 (+),score=70.30 TRINITY_DN16870_c0_g1_i1:59-754(+)
MFHTRPCLSKLRAAVVLSGNGVYDGTEIQEGVAVLVALSRHGVEAQCFAPDMNQHHVVNHTNGEEMNEKRNIMIEAARLCRGNIKNLNELRPDAYSMMVVPGGFGAAKNLSTFGFDGTNMKVDPVFKSVLESFHASQKYIGMCCISPIIAAKVLPTPTLTLGKPDNDDFPYGGAIGAATSFGAVHSDCDVDEVCVDEANRLVTTPAYMKNAAPHEVHDSVNNMIAELVKRA